MPHLVKLTQAHDKPIYINPASVLYFVPSEQKNSKGTMILLKDDTSVSVVETLEEVAKKINNGL